MWLLKNYNSESFKEKQIPLFQNDCSDELASEDDSDRRIEFYETITQRVESDSRYLHHLCFIAEATILLNDNVNKQNVSYCSNQNSHWIHLVSTKIYRVG